MKSRLCSRLMMAFLLTVVLLGVGCNLQLHNGYAVVLKNDGRDPIHLGDTRCPQNQTTHVGFVGGEYEPELRFALTRNDINLGTLTLRGHSPASEKREVVVTMTEPVYFDFHFESADTTRVKATYTAP